MIRKINVALICAGTLFATQALATTEHLFSQGRAIEYELPSNDPQIFSNIFFWKIAATCTIISDHPRSLLSIKMLHKTGSVNATELAKGASLGLVVQPGDKVYITAESGAKVELLNQSKKTIIASCSASSSTT